MGGGTVVLTAISSIAAAVSAICALITIRITVKNNKENALLSDRLENKKFISARFESLCFDRIVSAWDRLFKCIIDGLNKIKTVEGETEIKKEYDIMSGECKRFEEGLRLLKIFDHDLYKRCASELEGVEDQLAGVVNKPGRDKCLSERVVNRCLAETEKRGFEIMKKVHEFDRNVIWGSEG